jgi:hypothetical protein
MTHENNKELQENLEILFFCEIRINMLGHKKEEATGGRGNI